MTTFDRIEPRLPELIDELAAARVPDYFDDLLQSTASETQRPAWSAPERWIPMGEIAQRLPARHVPWRPIALFATLVLIVTAGLLVYAGTRHHVPAPFGPAENGQMFFSADGVIMASDPVTGITTRVDTGEHDVTYPLPSYDGTQILFDHTDGSNSTLFVSGVDGSDAHQLPGTFAGWTWAEWSPDGREIGIVSQIDGVQTASVLAADGSGQRLLPLDREVLTFWWLPDGGIVFTGAQNPGDQCRPDGSINRCALFVVGADGQEPQMLLDANEFSGISTSISPTGKQVLYVRWATSEEGRLHIFDLDTGVDRVVQLGLASTDNINRAMFSPDGSQILFDHFTEHGDYWAVAPTTGGSFQDLGPEWPDHPDGTGPEAHWSPDGKTVTAFYPGQDASLDQLWMLDATGQGADRRLALTVGYLPEFQRVAP